MPLGVICKSIMFDSFWLLTTRNEKQQADQPYIFHVVHTLNIQVAKLRNNDESSKFFRKNFGIETEKGTFPSSLFISDY